MSTTKTRILNSSSNSLRLSEYYTGKDVTIYGGSDILDTGSGSNTKVCVNNHYKDHSDFDVNYFCGSKELGLVSKNLEHICLDVCGVTYFANTDYLEIAGVDFSTYTNQPNFAGSSWAERWSCAFRCKVLTGVLAIIDVMRHRPKSLTIKGMTLYASMTENYIPNYVGGKAHNLIPHLLFLREMDRRSDVFIEESHFLDFPIKQDATVRYDKAKKGFVPDTEEQYIDIDDPSIVTKYSFPAIHRSA